jgi:protein involved in polysaccharide export with SLBB domain
MSKSMSRIGPGEYLVMGRVVSPGMYPVDSAKEIRVSQAIQQAGGFAQFADKKYVILRRGGGGYMQRIYIDLDRRSSDKPSRFDRVFRSNEPHYDPFIRAGDAIIVEEITFSSF